MEAGSGLWRFKTSSSLCPSLKVTSITGMSCGLFDPEAVESTLKEVTPET